MFNKLMLMAFTLVTAGVTAQSNFPYTHVGVGEQLTTNNPAFLGQGNFSTATLLPNVLNTNNPASYSYLKYQFPIFSIGATTRFSTNTLDGATEKNFRMDYSEIALGMSLGKRFGFAFGLKPSYKKEYSIMSSGTALDETVIYRYNGYGKLYKGFVGASFHILNFDSLKWTVGANVGGLFGQMSNFRSASVPKITTNGGGVGSDSTYVKSFFYEFGSAFSWTIKGGNNITVAGTFQPMQNITAQQMSALYVSSQDVLDENTYQVLQRTDLVKGKITFASAYSVGLSYKKDFQSTKKDGNIRNSALTLMLGYNNSTYSKYKESFGDSIRNNTLKDVMGYQIGLMYTPETHFLSNAAPKFFERAQYRIGYYYNTLPYTVSGTQLTEWAGTIGFGFPLLIDRRLDSSLQLGLAIGKRGANVVGALNETFYTFNIGFLFAPSINDRWFTKTKLD